jgi:oligoribonuclease NrnB/cAMP/cGMP phosphodiesterase (DHH superfamily)
VAVVDFSYRRPVILDLQQRVQQLVVLDHHLTAQAELQGLDFAHFDMDKSGAHLAWNFFHPGQPLPELLAYVEDKDLWRFLLPQSKEVTAALRSYPMDFELWNSFEVEDLKREGVSLLRFQEKMVVAACAQARIDHLLGYQIPIVNATEFRSEIANRLCELLPQYPFAAAYYDTEHGIRSWSLRSVGDFDVSAVAAKLGGGGHKNASGFIETDPVPSPPSVPTATQAGV